MSFLDYGFMKHALLAICIITPLFGILGTIAYNVMHLIVPYITQTIIDTFLTSEKAEENLINERDWFFQLIIAMIVFTLLRTLIVYLVCMDVEHVSQKVLYRIRTHLFDKIERQDMSFYNKYRTGDLMTRVTGDLDAVRHMIAWVLRSIVESFSLLLATAAYFFYMNPKLALAVLSIAPFIIFMNNKAFLPSRNKPRHPIKRCGIIPKILINP